MSRAKVAITLDEASLEQIDQLVDAAAFPSRSAAIQHAVDQTLDRLHRGRLVRECAKLDPAFERAMADEGLSDDLATWPAY